MTELGVSDEDVRIFKEWLVKQPYLPQKDDYCIRCFIRASKNSVQAAKIRYDNYYGGGCVMAEATDNWDLTSKEAIQTIKSWHMAVVEVDDTTYVYSKWLDSSDINQWMYIMRFFVIAPVKMWEKTLTRNFVLVMDGENITLAHAMSFPPPLIEKIFKAFTLKGYPASIKKMHFVNTPGYSDVLIRLVQKLAPEKLRSRFSVHRDSGKLQTDIPKNCLPQDYGGLQKPLSELSDEFHQVVLKYRDRIIEERAVRLQEAKLRPKDKDALPGTFRKLEVD